MKDVGTLQDLGVKAGDVVKTVDSNVLYDVLITSDTHHPRVRLCDIGKLYALSRDGSGHQSVEESSVPQWRIVSRATPTPKLWRDMTPEEKGVLLLAHHEGKMVEWSYGLPWGHGSSTDKGCIPKWSDSCAYRIKPEPKVEVVVLYGGPNKGNNRHWGLSVSHLSPDQYKITFNLIDGKPDCTSVKMECI